MTTLRSRIFITVSIVVLLILAISVALVVISKKKSAEVIEEPSATTTASQVESTDLPIEVGTKATEVPAGAQIKPATTEEALRNAAKQMAKIFTERYGSYSSDASGDNIRSVEPMVTNDLWGVLKQRLTSDYEGEFIGVTTQVIAANVADYTDQTAVVEISAIRATTKGDETTSANQNATIKLIRSGDSWLIDDIKWE